MKRTLRYSILLLIAVQFSCSGTDDPVSDWDAYIEQHAEWQKSRLERLKSDNGWLNLAGLFWLEEGENTIGSDASDSILFPENFPENAGAIELRDTVIRYIPSALPVMIDSTIAGETLIRHDQQTDRTVFRYANYTWYVVRRGHRYGIRLRDLQHPRLKELERIPSYPFSKEWVVEATLERYDTLRRMEVPTVIDGYTETYDVPGELKFVMSRTTYTLLPFQAGKGYFLIFGDETNGIDTYGAGRFLYVEKPDTGKIIIDFNRAYNPPCAFSPYATCPLPPLENQLALEVTAGEKAVHLD
jgi:uncharacterized protein (DUF1684 family)